MLEAELAVRLSRLELDVAFTVAAGEVLALLGPNGSGKSTTLRALMGLVPLAGGRVVLDGTALDDPAAKVRVPTEQRPIGLMFQDYLLFPHLSAVDNVAFGLRARGTDKKVARQQAHEALARLGLVGVDDVRPRAMSGGQQQRVAMARALVTAPRLLLLDEPLAALDVSTKSEVRRLLRQVLHRSEAANVLVTHDLLDAVTLGDRMLVIEDGAVVQTGTPAEVTAHPRSQYVADLAGVNLLRGTADGRSLLMDGGGRLEIQDSGSGDRCAVIAPAQVSISRQRPESDAPNTWSGQIGVLDLLGDRVRVRISGAPSITAEVSPAAVDELALDDGGELWVHVDPSAITVYEP